MIEYLNGNSFMTQNIDNDITIVTAFFDIGRGDWTQERGYPHYLHRTTDTYFERFAHLAQLENEMFIFTTPDNFDRISDLRGNKPTTVFEYDFYKETLALREDIELVQHIPDYVRLINQDQRLNPEYWSPEYVVVNMLKSTFACMASVQSKNDMIAWLDFGYCRTAETLNNVKHWRYAFNPDLIHMFKLKDYVQGTTIHQLIATNDVHITGPCIVASKKNWRVLEGMIRQGLDELISNQLIDDDQLLLLLSYLTAPELFQLHQVGTDDWFRVFKDFAQ